MHEGDRYAKNEMSINFVFEKYLVDIVKGKRLKILNDTTDLAGELGTWSERKQITKTQTKPLNKR
jgi:hypothetical protein